MFPLNTIIAWSINIIMNKKYDNNNIIIASRAYFLHLLTRVNSTNVLDEELRIGGRGRQMNSKVRFRQTR
jgi:hypothetical protein